MTNGKVIGINGNMVSVQFDGNVSLRAKSSASAETRPKCRFLR